MILNAASFPLSQFSQVGIYPCLWKMVVLVTTQVPTLETDCSKRHIIDYETCSNSTEASQQKCTICKVVAHTGSNLKPAVVKPFDSKYNFAPQPAAVVQCTPVERLACIQVTAPNPMMGCLSCTVADILSSIEHSC